MVLQAKSKRGGTVRRYERRFSNRNVVVIAELVGKECYLITTYEEGPEPTRN